MATKRPTYFYIEPATWESWVAALGFTAASKLAGACMTYFFSGEIGSDVKLTKTAKALFEGERARLDNRRAKIAAKEERSKPADEDEASERTSANVENSRDKARKQVGNAKKPRENFRCIYDSSAPTSPVPAETPTQSKPKLEFYNPQTPLKNDEGSGLGVGTTSVVSQAEFAAMVAGGLGYDTPGAYGMGTTAPAAGG